MIKNRQHPAKIFINVFGISIMMYPAVGRVLDIQSSIPSLRIFSVSTKKVWIVEKVSLTSAITGGIPEKHNGAQIGSGKKIYEQRF